MEQLNLMAECSAFAIMICLSAIVGLYYGCVERKQNTVSDYLLGGRDMTLIPITISLIASHISGITLLGVPPETYIHGTQYALTGMGFVLTGIIVEKFYLPVFYELQLTSMYEYLEYRFDGNVRSLMSIIYAFSLMLYIPVVIYIPALAFSQVTGLNVHTVTKIICSVCIFYTTIGGLKAVVWTDAIQGFFTAMSLIAVIVMGLKSIGGLRNMIKANEEGDRIEFFRMDPDPFLRNSFWTTSIGSLINSIAYLGLNPSTVQRFVALPTYKLARNALMYLMLGVSTITSMTVLIGMLIYAKYKNCDPSTANYIEDNKSLLPYYVMDIAASYPGITGIFVAGLVSAALSTMSAHLNNVSGTIYEDLIVKMMGKRYSELTASIIMKFTVIVMGVMCGILVLMVEQLKGILQMAVSLNSVTLGAFLSVFTLGIGFPFVNTRGAIYAIIASLGVSIWITFGTQIAIMNDELKFSEKNISITGCPIDLQFKDKIDYSGLYRMNEDVYVSPNVQKVFTLSYMYFGTIGTVVGMAVGIIVSLVFPSKQSIDPKLLTPCIRKYMHYEHKGKTKSDEIKIKELKSAESQDTPL
ncbi:sodium-coupled monocarboxylate transporter 1-like [Sipha flava]|uniref:Sodium-coupled monocarboxylate transporter 1-like n=2 Tax=Sipha flava TaxID=143950 RepID=A0A8B8F696_9HEMI|nr:sodium-coupled monocarboxylate transporter 1-like [Sipha flava]